MGTCGNSSLAQSDSQLTTNAYSGREPSLFQLLKTVHQTVHNASIVGEPSHVVGDDGGKERTSFSR